MDDKGSSQGFQSVCKLCEALQWLLTLTHHSHTAQLQQVAQLDDDSTHCAVGSIQDHAVSWLHQGKKSLGWLQIGYEAHDVSVQSWHIWHRHASQGRVIW